MNDHKQMLKSLLYTGRQNWRESVTDLLDGADGETHAFADSLALAIGEISCEEATTALLAFLSDRQPRSV